jgi:cation-transporting ATPase E
MKVVDVLSTEVNEPDQTPQLMPAVEHPPTPSPFQGLSEAEVEDRRSHGLGNNVAFKTSRTLGQILRENLFTFFNVVLAILGILLVLFGLAIEALITSGVLLVNVIIAAVQEVRAKQNLDRIALLTRPRAIVIREGVEREVDPDEIVLDDVLCISPGDQIVVDGTVLSDARLGVDESLLTGESALVAKFEGDKVYSGSFCVTGQGVYQATRVGINSFANKLTLEARIFTRHFTPLQREVNLSIRLLMALVVFFAILLIINNTLNDVPMVQSVREASVLFGLAPSSLFLMIVVAYAVGAVRISNKGALVQQANSVESLCNVDVLCLDKTGTLTTNRINLEEIYLNGLGEEDPSEEAMRTLLGHFTASATVTNRTSEAILRACPGEKRSFSYEIPFSSQQGWSALVFDRHEQPGTYVLGAPELLTPSIAAAPEMEDKVDTWCSQGRRVLLFAYNPLALTLRDRDDQPLLPKELNALCLLGFSDELRPKVKETLKGFAETGIKIKFISGDNPETVASIVRQVDFLDEDQPLSLVSGLELAEMDEAQFARSAGKADVFGRITPRQKEQLVKALLEQGHYVAMTGDGINDILALKRANLGIAMQSGSEATRNVADIVLLEDSFGVLPEAFQEGQRILNGMQDILRLYMTRILCLAMLIAAIGFASNGFPITPRQNAAVGFITMSIPALFLALWAKPGAVPRVSLSRRLAHFVIPAVISIGIVGFGVYLYSLVTTGDEAYAQTMLTYFTIICGILLLIFVEPPTKWWAGGDVLSGDWRPTILAIVLLIMFFVFLVFPTTRDFYGLTLLRGLEQYIIIAVASIFWIFALRFVWRARLIERYLNMAQLYESNSD